ncbi:MAG TPA: ABC transporter family substrate-binding protein [Mycobacteriales bacterium]|nr:ABC transporter family substrate-binding protein [Mycobacteriales bacterium]
MLTRTKKRVVLIAPLAVTAVVLSACGSSKSNGNTGNGGGGASPKVQSTALVTVSDLPKVTIAQEQAPTNFNDLTTDGNAAETLLIEEGVLPFAFRGQLNVTEDYDHNLFTDAPALTSSSPETVVYHINPDAKWSDGQPIDATDFQYVWETNNGKNPAYLSASSNGYANIKSVTGSDNNKTVTVVFSTPYSDWQGLFGPILPAHLLKPKGVAGFNTAMKNGLSVDGKPISGGPYIQQSYTTGDNLVLVPNPSYWGTKPHVQQVVFRFIEDTTQFPDAIKNGEVDLANPQPTADEVAKYKSNTASVTDVYPQLVFEHIDFNFKNPFLGQLPVRQAVATAIDRKALIAGTVGQFAPDTVPLGNHLILNTQVGYVDNSGSYGKGDAAAADKILEAAGYTKSGDYYAKDGKTLEFGITCKNGNPLRVAEEEIMQSQLKAAGIKLDIKNTDKSIGDFTSAHEYDIALFAWVGGPFVSANQSIYSTPPKGADTQNTQFYSNPQVDSMFNTAVADLDPKKQIDEYNAIDKLIWNDMATLPLFQKPGVLVYPTDLGNVFANPTQDGYSYNIADWGKKAAS